MAEANAKPWQMDTHPHDVAASRGAGLVNVSSDITPFTAELIPDARAYLGPTVRVDNPEVQLGEPEIAEPIRRAVGAEAIHVALT